MTTTSPVRVSVERARGCGYRKPGGLYLVAPELTEPCSMLPLPVTSCPTCGEGIKPARSWTWIRPAELFPAKSHGNPYHNAGCPLGYDPMVTEQIINPPPPDGDGSVRHHRTEDNFGRAGLIWIGEAFYKTPDSFIHEAASMGVSRRIAAVPKGFEVGKTWVYLGHRKAIRRFGADITEFPQGEDEYQAGVITLFKPIAVEYVLRDGEENDDELMESLQRRNISPVKVIRDESSDG